MLRHFLFISLFLPMHNRLSADFNLIQSEWLAEEKAIASYVVLMKFLCSLLFSFIKLRI